MIETKYVGNMKVDVKIGGFTVHTDLPPEYKGDNTAPDPFTLFLASFAACSSVFALFYLDKHGLSRQGVRVAVEPQLTKQGMAESAKVFVTIPQDFPQEHENGLKAMVEGCKVGKHLKIPHEVVLVRK